MSSTVHDIGGCRIRHTVCWASRQAGGVPAGGVCLFVVSQMCHTISASAPLPKEDIPSVYEHNNCHALLHGGKGETTVNSLPIPRAGHSNRWMLPAAVGVTSFLVTFDTETRNRTRDFGQGRSTFSKSSLIASAPGKVFLPASTSWAGFRT